MQQREFRELIKEVQKEFPELSLDQIEEIVRDQFMFAQEHISKGSLTPVYFQYLGRFRAKQGRIDWLKNRREHDTNNEQQLPNNGDSETTSEE